MATKRKRAPVIKVAVPHIANSEEQQTEEVFTFDHLILHASEYRPGFFERLTGFSDAAELTLPSIESVFPAEEFIRFCAQHDLEHDAMRTVATGGAYHKVVRDGALVRLWYWVRGFVLVPVSGGGPDPDKEIPLKVPIVELHLPVVTGMKLDYKYAESRNEEVSFRVSIAGAGLGGGTTRTAKCKLSGTIAPGKCRVLVVTVYAKERLLRHGANGNTVRLVDVVEVDPNGASLEELNTLEHQRQLAHECVDPNAYGHYQEDTLEQVRERTRRPWKEEPPDEYTKGFEIERGSTYQGDWSVTDALGLTYELSVNAQALTSFAFEYTFRPGYKYRGLFGLGDMVPCNWHFMRKENGVGMD